MCGKKLHKIVLENIMADFDWKIGDKYVTHDGDIITYSVDTDKSLILCKYKGAGPETIYIQNNDPNHEEYMKVSSTPNANFKNAALAPELQEYVENKTIKDSLLITNPYLQDDDNIKNSIKRSVESSSGVEGVKVNLTGTKHDLHKPMFACLPPDALLELGKVAELGARKYGHHNFRNGIESHRYIDAAFRHIIKYMTGEDTDPDDGNNHLASGAWNLLAALQATIDDSDLDTRYKRNKT